MSALPIGGEGGDPPRRGVPAENEAVPGGGASGVREETEPRRESFFGLRVCVGKEEEGVVHGAVCAKAARVRREKGAVFGQASCSRSGVWTSSTGAWRV